MAYPICETHLNQLLRFGRKTLMVSVIVNMKPVTANSLMMETLMKLSRHLLFIEAMLLRSLKPKKRFV
jgi:hypothetical protein